MGVQPCARGPGPVRGSGATMTEQLSGGEAGCEIALQRSGEHELITVVRVSGELDLLTASTFRSALDLALEPGATVIVDMADVEFIGSIGITTLEDAARRAHGRRSELLLRNASPMLRKLIQVLALEERLPLEENRSPAKRANGKEAPLAHRRLLPL